MFLVLSRIANVIICIYISIEIVVDITAKNLSNKKAERSVRLLIICCGFIYPAITLKDTFTLIVLCNLTSATKVPNSFTLGNLTKLASIVCPKAANASVN